MVVMVEDIETMLSGLALAGAALGVTPAPISAPARLALPAPAPERTRRPRRDALSEDERKARKRAQNAAFRAKQKAEAAGGGAS
jgi:hypothetical protein